MVRAESANRELMEVSGRFAPKYSGKDELIFEPPLEALGKMEPWQLEHVEGFSVRHGASAVTFCHPVDLTEANLEQIFHTDDGIVQINTTHFPAFNGPLIVQMPLPSTYSIE